MTREEAIIELKNVLVENAKIEEPAIKKAINALQLLGHLKDRPCAVCEFRKETGCCKWSCVFEEV